MTATTSILSLFMLALALVPVLLVLTDGRGRTQRRERLAELRQAAQLGAQLRRQTAQAPRWNGTLRG
ncbi:hypothetical protein [Sabulicella rubraurantiaca]|uniref:hypothetical protein n=1 Tax=Sabulicella rubraurantiaca TaxID=2811429 RepID=UPI001A96F6E6|nr:hypothetical protein [Sabulicella rubraurantiaca]